MFDLCRYMLARFGVASVFLAITCIAALVLIRVLRCRAPFFHSAIWSVVLLQGIVVFHVPVSLPSPFRTPQSRPASVVSDPLAMDTVDPFVTVENHRVSKKADARWWRLGWPIYLLIVWVGGIVFLFSRWSVAYIKLIHSLGCEQCDLEEWNREWSFIQQQNGISNLIPLYVSQRVGPFLYWHPNGHRVVVPFSLWQHLSKQKREAVLRHELAHYKRGDVFKVFAAQLLVLPHWFNPFAWVAMRRFENSVEWGCDDIVRNSTPDAAIHFAQALLSIAELSNRRLALTSPMNGGGVSQRIRRVLCNDTVKDSGVKNGLAFGLLVSLVLLHGVRVNLIAQEHDRPPTDESVKTKAQLLKDLENSEEYRLLTNVYFHQFEIDDRVGDPGQLSGMKNSTRLALHGDKINDETLKQMADFTDLKSIGIFQSRITGTGLKHLANLQEIQEVVFIGPLVTDVWLRNLPAWPKLSRVTLSDSNVTDAGLHNLERYPAIRSLSLRNTNIGDSGLEVFRHLPVLTTLDLLYTQVSDTGLANLKHTAHVYSLSLASPNIQGHGLAHLLDLNDIGRIHFSGASVTREWLQAVEPLRDVYRLYLHETRVTDEGLSAIKNWRQLERVSITDETITDASVESLRHLSAAKQINLRTRIGVKGVDKLRKLLPDAAVGDGRLVSERQ